MTASCLTVLDWFQMGGEEIANESRSVVVDLTRFVCRAQCEGRESRRGASFKILAAVVVVVKGGYV